MKTENYNNNSTKEYIVKYIKNSISLLLTASLMLTGCGAAAGDKAQAAAENAAVNNSSAAGNVNAESGSAEQTKVLTPEEQKEADEQAYMDFLRGDATLISDVEKKDYFRNGNRYSYEELVQTYINNDEDTHKFVSHAFYSYIDCGMDGIPEMLLKLEFGGLDTAYEYFILKNKEDGVHLCADASGYYRSMAYVNKYGYITECGSGGASVWCADYSFVDAEGTYHFLYSDYSESSLENPVIPSFMLPQAELPEEYEDYSGYCEDENYIYCNAYSFMEYQYSEDAAKRDEYARSRFYTLQNKYDEDVAPEADYQKIYDDLDVKVCTEAEADKLINDHLKSFGVTEELMADEWPEWSDLAAEGIGKYQLEANTENDTINMLSGSWIYKNDSAENLEALYLEIKKNADFTININYKDKYTAPGYIRGHLILDYNDGWAPTRDRFVFYVEESNLSELKNNAYMEYYLIDSYVVEGRTATMTLDDVSYVESFFENNFGDKKPVFEKEVQEEDIGGEYIYLSEPEDDYYSGEDHDYTNDEMPVLSLVSEVENEVIDEDRWFLEVGISEPGDKYSDDLYTYEFSGTEGYGDKTILTIYDKEGKRLYTFDFHDFTYAEGYEYNDFVNRSIRYALVKDDLLYVNYYHRTYADTCPLNAYMIAIDMNSGWIEWKSAPLVSNSGNFVIAGDYIVTGYGFSAEDHYISLLNCATGSEEKRISIKKSPEYFALDDHMLSVRTYSYDLKYSISYE